MSEQDAAMSAIIAVGWVIASRWLPIKPPRSVLRDKTTLALSLLSDRFSSIVIIETLLVIDFLLLLAFAGNLDIAVAGSGEVTLKLYHLSCCIIFHFFFFAIIVSLSNVVYSSELTVLTEYVSTIKFQAIPPSQLLPMKTHSSLLGQLMKCRNTFLRAFLDSTALFIFIITVLYYLQLHKLQNE